MAAAIPALAAVVVSKYATAYFASQIIGFALAFVAAKIVGDLVGVGGKQKIPEAPPFTNEAKDRLQVIRSSVQSRRVAYGEVMVSGPLVYAASTGTDNEYLHMVVALTGHLSNAIGDVYFDEKVSTEYDSAYYRISKHLGADLQTVDADLTAEVAQWTSAHRLRGITYVYVRLKYSQDIWPNGIPNIKAVLRGKKVWDPRSTGIAIDSTTYSTGGQLMVTTTGAHGLSSGDHVFISGHSGGEVFGEYEITNTGSTTFTIPHDLLDPTDVGTGGTATLMKFSLNPALHQLDYLCSDFGLYIKESELDEDTFIAAANACEEQVALTQTTSTFTAVAGTDLMTRTDESWDIDTGAIVQVSTTGTLPGGLSPATNYYFIRQTRSTYKLATSLANCVAGTAIDITDAGSGTHTLTRISQPRYFGSGTFDLNRKPVDVMSDMTTATAGAIIYSQGKYRCFVGIAGTPTVTLDEDDLRGALSVERGPQARDLFNAVKGTYSSPDDYWQPTDFHPVTNATYEAQDDDEQTYRDIELPYTTNSTRAQRLAKIHLEKSRQGITVTMPCKLTALRVTPWDVVRVTNTRLGWTAKEFRVLEWKLAASNNELGVDLVLREDSAASYDWAMGEETRIDHAPDTTLPDLTTAAPPTGVLCYSGTNELFVNGDGTVESRIRVVWTKAADVFVADYEIQARDSTTGTDYQTVATQPADDAAQVYVNNVDDGSQYDVRVRSINIRGVRSSWASAATHTVIGKTLPPEDVTGFIAQENVASPWTGNVVTFRWTQVSDVDLAGYELRYMVAPFAWAFASVLTSVTRGTLITNAGLPPGVWVVGIKARDTSGNYSVNAVTDTVTVTNTNDILFTVQQAPNWRGTLSNMIMHPTRVLVPDSQTLASAMTDAQLWNTFVYNPYLEAYYEAPEADIGLDVNDLRVWAGNTGSTGPDNVGAFAPHLYIDYRLSAGAYDGFEHWDVGVAPARYVKARAVMDTSEGTYYLSGFVPTYDVQEHTESGTATASVGGTTVTFATPFYSAPGVQVTAAAVGGAARYATYESLTGASMVVRVFNSSGTDVGGAFSYFVTGA